jgi:hypothetical protein
MTAAIRITLEIGIEKTDARKRIHEFGRYAPNTSIIGIASAFGVP